MTNIYEWLESVDQPSYAPTSPPFGPMDEDPFVGVLTDPTYFDASHTWNPSIEQPQIYVESIPIDPSLRTMAEPPAPMTSGRTIVTVPEQFAEVSSKLLIYLAQIVDVPEISKDVDESSIGQVTFNTTEEMEALEPIVEEPPGSLTPNTIDGIYVNKNPMPVEIKDILDLRRVGYGRKTFYLVRTVGGIYYWFPSRRSYRDPQLHKSIRKYRRKSQTEAARKKARGAKKLRNGRMIRI